MRNASNVGAATMTAATGGTKRAGRGAYNYTVGGKRYAIREVRRSEGYPGKPLWHVSLMTGPGEDQYGPAFDAAETLAGAKHWCDVDAGVSPQESRP
jgi:hypothetical protein